MLNTDRVYHYQYQGQLGISWLSWIDFVAHSGIGDIIKQRVFPDKDLWSKIMVPKLKLFYFNHSLGFFLSNERKTYLTLKTCS